MISVDTDTLTELLSKAYKIQECASNTFGVKLAKDAFALKIKQIIVQINLMEERLEN